MRTYAKSPYGVALLASSAGSALPRAALPAAGAAALGVAFECDSGEWAARAAEHPWPFQAFAFVLGFVLALRTNAALARWMEARNGLCILRAKLADAAAQLASFDPDAAFGRRVAHLLSLAHAAALADCAKESGAVAADAVAFEDALAGAPPPSDDDAEAKPVAMRLLACLVLVPAASARAHERLPVLGGVADAEVEALAAVPDAPQLALTWLLDALRRRRKQGGLDVEPPVLSRTWQVISDARLGAQHAAKIAATPWPFPYAQLVAALLLIFFAGVPIVMSAFLNGAGVVAAFSAAAVGGYVALNEVARDLEDPFAFWPNGIPLRRLQHEFNGAVLSSLAAVADPLTPGCLLWQDAPLVAGDTLTPQHAESVGITLGR